MKFDVIVVAGKQIDKVLSYVKQNKQYVNSITVLARSIEAETTTYISKVSNLGFKPGHWSFFRVTGEMNNAVHLHIDKAKGDVLVLDDHVHDGVFEHHIKHIQLEKVK